MQFLHLTLLYSMLTFFSGDMASEYPPSSPTKILKSITANPTTTNDVVPGATNIIFQSKDGGQTWQDISYGLPENEGPESFFAGESDIYLRVKNEMYRSKSNLKTPVWEKENVPDPPTPRESWLSISKGKFLKCQRHEPGYRYIQISKSHWCERFLKDLMGRYSWVARTVFTNPPTGD